MATQIILTVGPDGRSFTLNDAIPVPPAGGSQVAEIDADYTATASDSVIIRTGDSGSAITVTLPDAYGTLNHVYTIVNANTTSGGTVTISPKINVDNDTTVDSVAVSERVSFISDGSKYWQISYNA